MTALADRVRAHLVQRRVRRAPLDERVREAVLEQRRAALAARADRAVLPPDDELVAYCWQVADALQCATAFVTVVTGEHQVVKAGVRLGDLKIGKPMALASSVCAYVIAQDSTLAVRDLDREPLLERCVVPGGLRAYLGSPIRLDERPIGALAAAELAPRRWTTADQAELDRLTSLVTARVEQLTT